MRKVVVGRRRVEALERVLRLRDGMWDRGIVGDVMGSLTIVERR